MALREKIEFKLNTPTLVIPHGFGELQESRHGAEEYRYMCDGEKIMWVPPAVHEYIQTHHDSAGTAYQITRVKKGNAAATWTVNKANPRNGALRPPAETGGVRQPNGSYVERGPALAPQTKPLGPQELSGPRAPQPAAQLAAGLPAYEMPLAAADRMAAALRDSIELWAAAMRHGDEHGIDARPNAGDIRATAATLFIEGAKR